MSQNGELQQQVEAEPSAAADQSLTPFFAVGLVINLVLITAFVWWARKQWKRSGKPGSADRE